MTDIGWFPPDLNPIEKKVQQLRKKGHTANQICELLGIPLVFYESIHNRVEQKINELMKIDTRIADYYSHADFGIPRPQKFGEEYD